MGRTHPLAYRRIALALATHSLLTFGAPLGCRSRKPRVVPDVLAVPVTAPASSRTSLALTIYSRDDGHGYAFVREERRVRLPAGRFVLRAPDIASGVVPESTRFELVSVDDDGKVQAAGELYEQRYAYDRLSPRRLLEKAQGERITAVWWAGGRKGQDHALTGTVVSTEQGVMLRLDSGEVTPIDGNARFIFSALPADLVAEPTLSWNVGSFEATDGLLRLSYRTERFNWRADYILRLDSDGARCDVKGWVTVVNDGDTTFESAKLQLVAGKVNTVASPAPPPIAQKAYEANAMLDEAQPHATEETLGELHLYTVEHPTTLPARSSKQVRFVVARGVPTTLEAESIANLEGDRPGAELVARIEHSTGPLAVPLPAGVARAHVQAASGPLVLVGEAPVEHTPVGEPWRVALGGDADQLTQLLVKNIKRLGRDPSGAALVRHSIELRIHNGGRQPRLRRVILDPGRRRIVGASGSHAPRLEGPTRAVLETSLQPGQSAAFQFEVDLADPNDLEAPGSVSLPRLSMTRPSHRGSP